MSTIPGFFDLQVNGYGGVDFNNDGLSAAELRTACNGLVRDGVSGVLATFITDALPAMCARLRTLVALREGDPVAKAVIRGIHLEGPFINETVGYRGAHPLDAIRPASIDGMRQLLDAGGGLVRLVTLAPERDPGMAVTAMLAAQRIVVSAGHTDASLDQLRAAADVGLRMVTHLGNGTPMQMHRHDNIVQRALSLSDRLWLCFIADGAHVPFVALGNYLRSATIDRCIVVSDAIAPAGLGPGRFTLGRWDLLIGEDLVARSPDGSHFVGSAISLPRAADNLARHLGLSPADVEALTCRNPRIALGID